MTSIYVTFSETWQPAYNKRSLAKTCDISEPLCIGSSNAYRENEYFKVN